MAVISCLINTIFGLPINYYLQQARGSPDEGSLAKFAPDFEGASIASVSLVSGDLGNKTSN